MNKKVISLLCAALCVVMIAVIVILAKTSVKNTNEIKTDKQKTSSQTKGEESGKIENENSSEENTSPQPKEESSNSSQPANKNLGIAKDIPSNASPNKYADSHLAPPIQAGPSYSGHSSPDSYSNMDDNIFMDALTYCGYSIQKQKDAGRMWQYVLSKDKKETGWLSNITYNGGCSGYETTSEGAPDIKAFEKGGLVCASYVAYVYYNYLPNVVGIDTSVLKKPEKSYLANDWYNACLDWEKNGYTKRINYSSSGGAGTFLKLDSHDEIPIGSIVCMAPKAGSDHCSHVCIYAGYKNNYHWVFHVGNENGPEFCSIERMTFGPDPQFMLAIFETPNIVK